jgi:dTDP-4-amino-4,6-dideoxygalactose transaminase
VNADLDYALGSFPESERVAQRCLSLPMFPELRADQQRRVVDALRAWVRATESAVASV